MSKSVPTFDPACLKLTEEQVALLRQDIAADNFSPEEFGPTDPANRDVCLKLNRGTVSVLNGKTAPLVKAILEQAERVGVNLHDLQEAGVLDSKDHLAEGLEATPRERLRNILLHLEAEASIGSSNTPQAPPGTAPVTPSRSSPSSGCRGPKPGCPGGPEVHIRDLNALCRR